MCGIAGVFTARSEGIAAGVARMTEQIRHRGPDGDGIWTDVQAGIGLGHRRLAVLDLSSAGQQPMQSPSGRWVVVFNGEIYNHLDIRREVDRDAGAAWKGHSDTETLVRAIELWGVEATLSKLRGMFAIAAWDRSSRSLWLARDRMGEKPLYYGWVNGDFVFGSELRAVRAYSRGAGLSVSRTSLSLLTTLNYIPAPWSIYREVGKLMPGSLLHVRSPRGEAAEPKAYWHYPAAGQLASARGIARPDDLDSWTDRVEGALRRAVKEQMLADVPLGALLSGGIDSSLIVALMQSESSRPINTFTIGFSESHSDESAHARRISQHLGTDHHELILTPQDALNRIPGLPGILDEPMADSSQIPTMVVMELARRHVTVALSGDGADELFGGYGRYRSIPQAWNRIRFIPRAALASLDRMAQGRPADIIGSWGGDKTGRLLRKLRYYLPRIARARTPMDLYAGMLMQWGDASVVRGVSEERDVLVAKVLARAGSPELVPFMMTADALTYLPDDVLAKVDRAAMAHSLETRAPFLDKEVVELASEVPLHFKLQEGRGKAVLHECLGRYVPRELFERPKQGFSVPLDMWLRGPLRDWAADLLNRDRIRQEGYFDDSVVERAWQSHLSGAHDIGHQLWSVIVFQSWLSQGYEASPA